MQQTQSLSLKLINKLELEDQLTNYCEYMRFIGRKNNSYRFYYGKIYLSSRNIDFLSSNIFHISNENMFRFSSRINSSLKSIYSPPGYYSGYRDINMTIKLQNIIDNKPDIFKKYKH